MEVLYQIRQQRPDVFNKLEVYIDGGIRRGTDVLKALCLGATAVGMGRPFLYAQSAYGEQGVQKLISIFARELRTGMKLMGAASVTDLTPDRVSQICYSIFGVLTIKHRFNELIGSLWKEHVYKFHHTLAQLPTYTHSTILSISIYMDLELASYLYCNCHTHQERVQKLE